MTILEFILQDKSAIIKHFIKYGITSHHMIAHRFDGCHSEIEPFCKMLGLEPGTCKCLSAEDCGSYTMLSFNILFDFQRNVDWNIMADGAYDNNITLEITGDDFETLRIAEVHLGRFYIWTKRMNFSASAVFKYFIKSCDKSTVAESLSYVKSEANKVLPHIEYYFKTLEDGSYAAAYNKLHNAPLDFKTNKAEFHNYKFYIGIRRDAHELYGYDMDILEMMMMFKYIIDNGITFFSNGLPADLDLENILNDCRKTYILSDKTRESYNSLCKLDDEYKDELIKLVNKLSDKYNVHKSYFFGHDKCFVDIPSDIDNNTDLSKPIQHLNSLSNF